MSLSSATSHGAPTPGGKQDAKENVQSGLSKLTKQSNFTPTRPASHVDAIKQSNFTPSRPASHVDATKRRPTSPMDNAFKIFTGKTRSPETLQYVESGVYQQSSICSRDKFGAKSKSEDDFEHGDSDYYLKLDFVDSDNENENKIDKLKLEKGYKKFNDKMKDFGKDVRDIHYSETLTLPDENVHGDYKRSILLDEYHDNDVEKLKLSFGNRNKKGNDGRRDLSKQEVEFASAKTGRMRQVSISSDHTAADDGEHRCSRHLTGAPSVYTHEASNTVHNSEMNTFLPLSNSNRRTTQKTIGSPTRLNNTADTGDARVKEHDSGSITPYTGTNNNISNNSNDSNFDALERSEKSDIPDLELKGFKLDSSCVGSGENDSNIESPFAENRVTHNKVATCVNSDNSQPSSENVNDAAIVSLLLKKSADDTVFRFENIDESEVTGFTALTDESEVTGFTALTDESEVTGFTALTDESEVTGFTALTDESEVTGFTALTDESEVTGFTALTDESEVTGFTALTDESEVTGFTALTDESEVTGFTALTDESEVTGFTALTDESEVTGFTALTANPEQARVVGIPPKDVKKVIIQSNAITNLHRSETTHKYIMGANANNGVPIKRNFTPRGAAHQKNVTNSHKNTNVTQRIQMLDEMALIQDIESHNKKQIHTYASKILVNNKETNKSIPPYSYYHGNKVGNKSTKTHSIVSNPKRLQLEALKLPKPALLKKNSLAGFTYVLNMKAINRLLFGPYSKSVNQISPVATSRKHLTKATKPKSRQAALRSRPRYSVAKENTSNKPIEHGSDMELLLRTSTPRNTSNPLKFDEEFNASNKHTNKEIHNGKTHLKTVSNRDGTMDRACNQIDVEMDEITGKYFVNSDIEDLELQETVSDCLETIDVKTVEVNSSVWESKVTLIESANEENNIAYIKNDDKYHLTGVSTKIGSQNETEGQKTHHLHFGIVEVKTREEDSKNDKTEHDNISTMSNELSTNKDNGEPLSTELGLEDEVPATKRISQVLKQADSGSAEITKFRDFSENKTSPIKNHYDATDSGRKQSTQPADLTNLNTTPTSENNPTSTNKEAVLQDFKQSDRINDAFTHSSSSLKSATIFPGSPKSASVYKHSENASTNGKSSKSISIDERSTFGILNNSSHLVALEDENFTSLTSPKHSPKNSPRQSLDSVSRKSVDFRIKNVTKVVLPSMDEEPKAASSSDESFIRNAIPFLPLSLAVFCLVLNVVIPGSGTAMSGLFVLCCGQPRLLRKDDQILTTMCVNCMVGLAQLFTVSFFLVGWFWSVVWGVRMVLLSVQHRNEARDFTDRQF